MIRGDLLMGGQGSETLRRPADCHVVTPRDTVYIKKPLRIFVFIHLQSYNAKHAQFKILPRYKVKSEGEFVQVFDQIILESVKSPGQFFHASAAWKIDHFTIGSELNLGIQPAGFTVVKSSRPVEQHTNFVKGGSVIRLFHKELEAYLVAEGLFDEEITEDVHLRIREVDQLIPKTLYPSSSGNTYWQVEAESSILNGRRSHTMGAADPVPSHDHTPVPVHYFRPPCDLDPGFERSEDRVPAASGHQDEYYEFTFSCLRSQCTVMHYVDIRETDEIQFETYSRIEHVITGFWLHALRGISSVDVCGRRAGCVSGRGHEEYIRRQLREAQEESGNSMKSLRWDGASLRKISASGEKMYHDAYTIQQVEPRQLVNFNFVGGMVPFLLNLILDRKEGKILNAKKAHKTTVALDELKDFMLVKNMATKERQKLMRNLRVIDLLVRLLQCPLQGAIDQTHLTKVFKGAYDVLYTYMIGNSRKNALYFAKYIDFFQTQITVKVIVKREGKRAACSDVRWHKDRVSISFPIKLSQRCSDLAILVTSPASVLNLTIIT
ncbi:hypothetical protein LSH36_1236g00007 [Paralvinella palmiformis]|uniref:Uncharacterized protein n=1 Tax=Paralvinella palmiformis TaxID=53620 RepID=A0AAD9MPP7_9ANNE|nr:hypothetical protein LSH36_1236g00007 [Paralvinella palmiformis]